MLTEQREISGGEALPTWDERGEWVRWKDQVFPFVNFYLSHEVSLRLLNLLEYYPRKSKEFREKISSHMEEESDFLVRSLMGMSAEALREAFYGSMAVKHYLNEEKEEDRIRAEEHLIRIRRLLHFDELFQKWQSPWEGRLGQAQAEVPAQTEIIR